MGINAPIYRVDVDAVREYFNEDISLEDIPKRLVQDYNERKKEEIFQTRGISTIDSCRIEAFLNIRSTPTTSSWVRFFQETSIDFGAINSQLQHLICFCVVDNELYAFTAGQSAVVFERFVDLTYPIEVGRRIAKPEVKSARANQITGSTLASDLHFRDPRRITYAESLDTVWGALGGYVQDTKLDLKALTDIFGIKTKVKVDVSSALRFGPKIQDPSKMIALIRWLAEQEQGDLAQDDGWAALDAIKLLSPRKKRLLINKLRKALAEKIFRDKDTSNLALTHAEIALYANATQYVVTQNDDNVIVDSTIQPDLNTIVENATIDEDYAKNLFSIVIHTKNEDYGQHYGTEGTLLAHLNGELTHGGKTYFLLAGKWYEVNATYIEEIKKDFLNLVSSLDLQASEIGLKNWPKNDREGAYNQASLNYDEKINGDTILTDNVELFDTLAFHGDRLYILHVKKNFNVKIRDVRSQLLTSAQIIENDLRNNSQRLKKHHAQLVSKGRTQLSEDEFLKLFQKPRTYALCYGTKEKVTSSTINKFTSSVAKMEVVSLNNQFRQISTDDSAVLRLVWIPLVD